MLLYVCKSGTSIYVYAHAHTHTHTHTHIHTHTYIYTHRYISLGYIKESAYSQLLIDINSDTEIHIPICSKMSGNIPRSASRAVISKYINKQTVKYIFTTHFWGPVSNFGIPIAALLDLKKDPNLISGPMTFALVIYSGVFMRYALAVTPKNYLLFGCHVINSAAQLGQGYRFLMNKYYNQNNKKEGQQE